MKRKLAACMAVIVLLAVAVVPAAAKDPTPPGQGKHQKHGMITQADRKAAAANKAALGVTVATGTAAAAVPGGTPDYFGTSPNFANSPLPVGPVGTIVVDVKGSGYSAGTTVAIADIAWGSGTGATASPTIDPATGAITAIAVTASGTGYIAPQVTITDPAGTGIDAAAHAVLDPALVTGGIKKFQDALPGLGSGAANALGQYIPIAVADKTTYTKANGYANDSEYYEIGLVQYCEQLSSSLPPTLLRGYVQIATSVVPGAGVPLTNASTDCNPANATPITVGGVPVLGVDKPHYLGPVIVATGGDATTAVPVRVKFTNFLPTGAGGDLFIPTDTTVMGSGTGPTGSMYTENRATIHLHGGNTPWISDGTQHQWITPAGETTAYPEGVSVENVPDMAAAGCNSPTDGCQTFYYTNQQSARLLFYHDHAYGITRLNVYAGEAAGFVLTDAVEQGLISSGVLPGLGTPLVIQDRTFVPPAAQLAGQDPTWDTTKWGTSGLWLPHVYMPNQNPYDMSGANAMGRWDYGQWFWPPFTGVTNGVKPNPYCLPTPPAPGSTEANPGPYDCSASPGEPPFIPGTPNPSIVPEAFADIPLVNGTAYPTLSVPAGPVRLRILNAANDRFWNLSLFQADPAAPSEVKMVPFNGSQNAITPFPSWWYTPGLNFIFDDRAGGVPDPTLRGPAMIQIGTEGGFLPAPVVVKNQPINYVYNRRDITVLSVNEKALLMGPAERADVVVDFSQFAGKTLILYNDAPAPVPALDPRVDYYTGDADQTSTGGAPTTLPGYGPNTRTIMQIHVAGTDSGTPGPVDYVNPATLTTLQTALPVAYAASQPKPLVPNAVYNTPFGASYPTDSYVRISDTKTTVQGDTVTSLSVTNGGGGYTSAPAVGFTGGGGTGAAATAVLGPAPVASLTLTNGGSGYTSAPTVGFTGGGGTGAAATAALAATGSVKSVAVSSGGSGYRAAPTVTFSAPPAPGVRATGTATVQANGQRSVTSITITNPGSGYTTAPTITFTPVNGGSGAAATATLGRVVASLTLTNGGAGYTSAPIVGFTGGGGSGAVATATLAPRVVASLTLTNGGAGYTSAPTVGFTGGGGTGAAATAAVGKLTVGILPKSIIENFDPDYGRMNALLGTEIANTTGLNQTSIPYSDVDAPTELFMNTPTPGSVPLFELPDGTQIWKITHNGVDTHALHWHMFNLQVINRVGWDGAIRPPDANEIGWKDTIRMNPLEDIVVAMRPIVPTVPFPLPNSIRPLSPAEALGTYWGNGGLIGGQTAGSVDPANNPVTYGNQLINYGYEFVWHCHLLGHEENIMMRSIGVSDEPIAPSNVTAVRSGSGNNQRAVVTWKDNSYNETGWIIQQATSPSGPWTTVGTVQIPLVKDAGYTTGATQSFTTPALPRKGTFYFQVLATDVVGLTQTFPAPATGFPPVHSDSLPAVGGAPVTTN